MQPPEPYQQQPGPPWPPQGPPPGQYIPPSGHGPYLPGGPSGGTQPTQPYPGFGAQPPGPPPGGGRSTGVILGILAGAFAFVVALVVLAVLLVRDSGSGGGATPRRSVATTYPAVPGEATATPTTAAATEAAAVTGVWDGTYTCAQGLTRLRLTITWSSLDDGLGATFSFSPHPDNPTVPRGAFAMKGTFTDGSLSLRGDHWIIRPESYQMVGLRADVVGDRPSSLRGTVTDTQGCTTFSVSRVSG